MLSLVTGKLGSGKSLFAVSIAWKYAAQGRRVVSNFPIDFSSRATKFPRHSVEVLPDLPTGADLEALGRGGDNERVSGVLIVDEGARWLNSRDWNASDRARILDWLLHSRKRGWDVVLVIQHHNMLDKQVREGLAEMHVICRRFDRVRIGGIKLPHIHQATTYYGINPGGTNGPPKAEAEMYRPQTWGRYYDTAAEFSESRSPYSMLSRWHVVERYRAPMTWRRAVFLGWILYVLSMRAAALFVLGGGRGWSFDPFGVFHDFTKSARTGYAKSQ